MPRDSVEGRRQSAGLQKARGRASRLLPYSVPRIALQHAVLAHELFDALNVHRDEGGEDVGLAFAYDDHVFEPDVDLLFGDAQRRLYREDHAGAQRPAVAAHVVRRHPDPVAERGARRGGRALVTLHELARARLVDGLRELRASERPTHVGGGFLHDCGGRGAGPYVREYGLVAFEVEAVQLTLPVAELTIDGPHARHVAHVVAVVGRVVHQQEFAVAHHALARVVVREDGVGAAGDERVVRVALRPVAVVDVLRHGVQLVLADVRDGRAHGLHQREPGEARRLSYQLNLARALDEARLV